MPASLARILLQSSGFCARNIARRPRLNISSLRLSSTIPKPLHAVQEFYQPVAGPSTPRHFTTTARWLAADASPAAASAERPQMKIEPRMRIQFTCTAPVKVPSQPVAEADGVTYMAEEGVKACGHRNTHEFTKLAYEKGIVLVECAECKNRHLIADHLQWFTNNKTSDDPNFRDSHRTIVDLMKAKGEHVKRGRVAPGEGEVVEVYE